MATVQHFTSAQTSINSARLPAVYGKIIGTRPRAVFDYGCGRFTDHIKAAVGEAEYMPFDPFNQPDGVNADSLRRLAALRSASVPVTVACSNVLNVIDSDDVIQGIADKITSIVRVSGGAAYITVYEGNRSGEGKQTGPDQYQRNEPLRNYLRFFPGAAVRSGMIIVK